MSLYVKKFGGSSVATPEKMLNIANRVLRDRKPGDKIVIVVSAMGDTTDDLLALASKVSDINHGREMDMLLATGEQISISLMAMTFRKLGVPAVSLTGPQAGIIAGGAFGKATIDDVKPERVFKELEEGKIVIVAGFQGLMKMAMWRHWAAVAAMRQRWHSQVRCMQICVRFSPMWMAYTLQIRVS